MDDAQWSNVETDDASEIPMFTGQYRQMQFAFTEPGVYLVQVNVEGHVRQEGDRLSSADADWSPISPDDTIASPVRWYTFYVGSEADLDVALEAGAVSTTEGVSTLPITVTANNGGPNGAENVEVEINLPAGLSAPATLPAGASSSECGVIAWEIGAMASGASPTLSFNATVDTGATGTLTANAEIRSTTFDPDAENNAASAEATLSGTNVRPPFFPGVTRSIVEHAEGQGPNLRFRVRAVNDRNHKGPWSAISAAASTRPGDCEVAEIAAVGSPVAGSWGEDCETGGKPGRLSGPESGEEHHF